MRCVERKAREAFNRVSKVRRGRHLPAAAEVQQRYATPLRVLRAQRPDRRLGAFGGYSEMRRYRLRRHRLRGYEEQRLT